MICAMDAREGRSLVRVSSRGEVAEGVFLEWAYGSVVSMKARFAKKAEGAER